MLLSIPKDYFDNPTPPRLFLCTTNGKRIQELNYYDGSINAKWNTYSELQFSIDRTYIDVLNGIIKTHPSFGKAESLRLIEVEGLGFFILQDSDDSYSDKDSKSLSAFSLDYSLSSKYIEHFLINKGSEDSKEVIYLSTIYGDGYTIDTNNLYKLATGDYNAYQDYYMCTIENIKKYEQVQVQESDYNAYIEKNIDPTSQPYERLYVKSYPNVSFYNPAIPELSLLHLIMNYAPDWSIGNVDTILWRKERSFEIDRIDVYSILTNDIVDTFKCVVEFDIRNKKVNFYEEADDGLTDDGKVLTRWDTDIYISRDNLANEVNIKVSGDNIKTKLKISGGDNIDISEVNLGKSYIMNLDYYHNADWMEQDLIEAYNDYLEAQEKYSQPYEDAVQHVLSAQEKYNDLLYGVAAETNVLLIDDIFKKLFCLYEPINNAYCNITITNDVSVVNDLYSTEKFETNAYIINKNSLNDKQIFCVQGYCFVYDSKSKQFVNQGSMLTYNEKALFKKLALYHVNEDTDANAGDNILLTLKHPEGHEVTIRIYNTYEIYEEDVYNDKYNYYIKNDNDTYTEVTITDDNFASYAELHIPHYKIKCIKIDASYGSQAPVDYEMSQWISGQLTDEVMGVKDYSVASIGTMGAYLVLAKDEKKEENIEDYGIQQLQGKYDVYLELFLTQTQNMLSADGKSCIATDEEPTGNYIDGTRWLDTNSKPVVLREYSNGSWQNITSADYSQKKSDAENYARYTDNYDKMIVAQEMLVKKKKEAEYLKSGYSVSGFNNILDTTNGSSLEGNMHRVAYKHFNTPAATYYTFEELKVSYPNGATDGVYKVGDDLYVWNKTSNAWVKGEYTIVRTSLDSVLPLYTFTTSYDPIAYTPNLDPYNSKTQYYVQGDIPTVYTLKEIADINEFNEYDASDSSKVLYVQTGHEYAVYLRGNTPYVAYKDSEGVWQTKREYISQQTDIEAFLSKDQMIRLSPLIREDVYEDSNFFFTTYESKEEEIKILKELMENATKELKTLSQPSFEFSMTMANILALPEFTPIVSQFTLGNFIRIELLPGVVKRSRLLECNIGLNDFSDFSCTFGNLVTTKSEIDLHAELLKQAVTAGKQVAAAKGTYQATVDTVNKLENSIANGLQDITLRVGAGTGQAISMDSSGMHFRKYKPGSTTEYEPEEMAIINNALVATNDSWKTSKAAFGKYTVDGVERWGPIAEYVTANILEGKMIKGGAIQIGDENLAGGNLFKVKEDGSVEIISNGVEKYAYKSGLDEIQAAYQYSIELVYNGSTVFSSTNANTIVTAVVKDYGVDITHKLPVGTTFKWLRGGDVYKTTTITDGNKPLEDTVNTNINALTANQINITHTDIEGNSFFSCQVDFDETQIQKGE